MRNFRTDNRGLSLLEVMLALALLGGALATLGQLIRIGSISGAAARDSATAQMLCESKMAEISSGIILPDVIYQQPLDDEGEWLYSIDSQQIDQQGLLAVLVTVEQDRQFNTRPVTYSLTRWIVDPEVEAAVRLEAEEKASAGADANQGQAGSTQSAASGLGAGAGGGGPGGGGSNGGGNNNGGNNSGGGPGGNGPGGNNSGGGGPGGNGPGGNGPGGPGGSGPGGNGPGPGGNGGQQNGGGPRGGGPRGGGGGGGPRGGFGGR